LHGVFVAELSALSVIAIMYIKKPFCFSLRHSCPVSRYGINSSRNPEKQKELDSRSPMKDFEDKFHGNDNHGIGNAS
jgi:hypothetical protein